MLTLDAIIKTYPSALHDHKEHMLREYLQHHILEIIFSSQWRNNMCFIGGTALRIVYDNQRFSEDLDFDIMNLSFEDFEELIQHITKQLTLRGIETERTCVRKGAYHGNIKFPDILYENQLSPMSTSKILIQIDTVDQGYEFTPAQQLIQRFETQAIYNVAPLNLLLAHKLFTVFQRKRMKGRDFFDILFLLKKTQHPDYGYLSQKAGITNSSELKSYILDNIRDLNLHTLHDDVQPFLFDPHDQSVLLFDQIIAQTTFID